ncbi:B3 domain-containing transcription repressor VAL2-like isoform X2 [Telopea speciosissima]|uniref:B3 domain-containing transcription repressor VAL2-like isoform X2 n=1 Tax=Telopea speciosissima TaxID=54955 RepID=UPI001CC80311|nr:B3 domain-containing transcription repressor VAL2-like isoform X2 [Telopea speciosissima]
MASKICMNGACAAASSIEWKKGWRLRSGGFANLCDKCGSAYEQSVFCNAFHSKESGWRECNSCGKLLHCGCIASKYAFELLDNGGVECINCARSSGLSSIPSDEKPYGFGTSAADNVGELRSTSVDNKIDGDNIDKRRLMQLGKCMEANGQSSFLQSQKDDTNESLGPIKREQVMPPLGELGSASFSNLSHAIIKRDTMGANDMYNPLSQTCLNITLGAPSASTTLALAAPSVVDRRDQSKPPSSFQQGQRSRQLLPKPLKMGPSTGLETNKDMLPQIRVARPPAEGRGRNQLLPRYWPRITDQELQQISGDSNSTIVPLFEKVLSASDAGRIGRLVLPKACAEAYFPPISQPEGLPLKIQDAKGKDWVFQFRFWPNNNSRMYVLEGVTPCIQSMQLQAGDTVTFSRIDPEGKLVMGFRKASNSIPLQSLKESTDPHLSALSEHLSSADADIGWHKGEKHGSRTNESLQQSTLGPEKKRTRNIGSKSKRLLIDSEDALELKLTWEEAQDLLRPPPSIRPSIVMVEDQEIEEYEEPPVFGKKTIFTARSSGGQDQWAQCDGCSKWRRLPVDALLPPKWTCTENSWDPSRSSCSASNEMSPKELENLLRLNMDFKKRRIMASHKLAREREPPSGLDALATAAVLGDSGRDSGTPSVATTTKHPRHRPGCTCIVCIQPPSGKGPKHKPTCTCNVCMTVKRRFKTLMMRKKKRQSEREAEIAQKKPQRWGPKDEVEVDSASRGTSLHFDPSDNEARQAATESESGGVQNKVLEEKTAESSKGQLDLNCHPDREEDLQSMRMSMMSLLQVANLPLEKYLKQNGLTSLICEQQQQASVSSHELPHTNVESEGRLPDETYFAPAAQERESGGDEGYCAPDQVTADPV